MECIKQNNSVGVEIGVTRDKHLCTESMGEQKKSGRLILVAIDESEEGINALQWAVNNLLTSQDRVILIHAQRNPASPLATASPVFMVPVDVLKMLEKDVKKSTEKIFARATDICKAKNVNPEMEARIGDAKEVICKAAKKYNPDLLIVGSHGSGVLKRVFLGSLSDYCVTHLQCPVVVVRPQKNKGH
jgi:nucleotide-binding universal stress UspA family protein